METYIHSGSRSVGGRSDLEIHMQTHISDKPFDCKECVTRLLRINQLKCHMKNILKDTHLSARHMEQDLQEVVT